VRIHKEKWIPRFAAGSTIGAFEGSSQIQQLTIAEYGYQEYAALRGRA
jgi:hypothetical protein